MSLSFLRQLRPLALPLREFCHKTGRLLTGNQRAPDFCLSDTPELPWNFLFYRCFDSFNVTFIVHMGIIRMRAPILRTMRNF